MKFFILFFALVFCFADSLYGQQHWQIVQTPWVPVTASYQTPYFLNTEVGFVYTSTRRRDIGTTFGIAITHLYRSTDGGNSWARVAPFDSTNISIQQILFTSISHGYLVIDSTFQDGTITGIIFETSDTGNTWRRITAPEFSVYTVYSDHGVIFSTAGAPRVFDNSWYQSMGMFPYPEVGKLFRSTDDGRSWSIVADIPGSYVGQVYGNRDSVLCLLSEDQSTQIFLSSSTDLGNHWSTVPLEQFDSGAFTPSIELGLSISPFSCDVLRVWDGLVENGHDVTTLYSSNLISSPMHWKPLVTQEMGSWVAGTSCARYISNANSSPNVVDTGLFRIMNGTLTPVGSSNLFEIDDVDFPNISVVGHGAVVFVSNPWNGRIMKTTDGGDGTLNAAALAPKFALAHSGGDTVIVDACGKTVLDVSNQNIACSYALFDSISVTGLDPAEYSIVSSHRSVCQSIPDTSQLTLTVPSLGLRDITIHFHYTDDEFTPIDTAMKITLNGQPGSGIPIRVFLQDSLVNAFPGDTIRIPFYLSGNTILPDQTNIHISFAIDTTRLYVLRFHPAIPGAIASDLYYSSGEENVRLLIPQISLDGSALLGTLECVTFVSDSVETSFKLAGGDISAASAQCFALSANGPGVVDVRTIGCGSATLSQFLKTGRIPIDIRSMYPNPAASTIRVDFLHLPSQIISYNVADGLGRIAIHGETSTSPLTIPIDELGNGLYHLELWSQGSRAAQNFMVRR